MFWKPEHDFGTLSNWSKHTIVENGLVFKTMEHYMMWHKARIMGDKETSTKILHAKNPYLAKQFGRQVRNFDQGKWEAERESIVLQGLRLKVEQHEDVKRILEDTGDALLAEASSYDLVWGTGSTSKDPTTWRGKNLLGMLWMKVRDEIYES
jgi:ribA/ribD-fused uncharacterized protein